MEEQPIKKKRGAPKGHPHWRPPGSKGAPMGHPAYEGGGRPKIWTEEKINEIADYFIEYMDDPSSLYFKKFVIWLRRNKGIVIQEEYLSRWAISNDKFADAHGYALLVQECKIVEGGLLKKFDSNLCKYLLSAVHGMSDKQIVEHQGNDVINVIHYGKQDPKTWKQEVQK